MTEKVGALLDEYPGPAAHDETPAPGARLGRSRRSPPTTSSRGSRWLVVPGPTSSGTTLGPSNGTRSSVLGSTCSIPSTCTAGKTICSGAGIRPIRSSPWRWPITPSRRDGGPATTRRHDLTVGRAHRPTSRSVQVHSAATRGSPHIAVPSPPHIPLACRAHQSECGRTPPARGRHHEEDPSP